MDFEELALRPVSGGVDVAAVAAWLDAQPFAFRDPVADDGWHLSGSSRSMTMERRARIADPQQFPLGVRVGMLADRVWLAVRANEDALARALQFLQWLAGSGDWTVVIDRGTPEPLGDPRRLFRVGLPDLDALEDDATYEPVMLGTLLSWRDHRRADAQLVLAVHSGGRWRIERDGQIFAGTLSPEALHRWREAVAGLDPLEPGFDDDEDVPAVAIEIVTPDSPDYLRFDPTALPSTFRPLAAMVTRWLDALARWTPGAVLDDLGPVRVVGAT